MRRKVGLLVLACAMTLAGEAKAEPRATSAYVPGSDGTQLAVDTWRDDVAGNARQPAIVQFTRYWRAFRGGGTMSPETIAVLTKAGYTVVIVDVRGTGASFGKRETEFSEAEVADFGAVFDWIAAQKWSNGRVATMGASYLGNTSELAAISRHPALRAVVPMFSDFSEYRDAVRPGGIRNDVIGIAWPAFVTALDRNDPCAAFAGLPGPDCVPGAPWIGGVRPVNEERDLLARAMAEHRQNGDLQRIVSSLTYSDDPFSPDPRAGITLDSVSPAQRWPRIDAARIPAFHWASWFDGGTARGVLTRFRLYKGPMIVTIGAWTHGGGRRADPFAGHDVPPDPAPREQLGGIIAMLDPLLKAAGRTKPQPREIRYFTLGANEWRRTKVWPPRGMAAQTLHFASGGALASRAKRGTDSYRVDFSVTTGTRNRWHTQLGQAVDYGERSTVDAKMLTYTSEPTLDRLEITGTPRARISLRSTTSDGAIFVYLEAVLPDGRSLYLGEGQRRLWFAGRDPRFTRREARPMLPGEARSFEIEMSPISTTLPAGTRLRIALAGADADTLERLPASGPVPTFTIERSKSFVTIPQRGLALRQ